MYLCKKSWVTKEICYPQDINEEKNFEMAVTELSDYNIVCIYRSPDGNFHIFLRKLDLVIQKLIVKGKILILSCDWNINFSHQNVKLNELQNLFLLYNLVNTVVVPTRITRSTKSLLDVIIINKNKYK
jgi:hypothetical protein